jgi:hypothetical protein
MIAPLAGLRKNVRKSSNDSLSGKALDYSTRTQVYTRVSSCARRNPLWAGFLIGHAA